MFSIIISTISKTMTKSSSLDLVMPGMSGFEVLDNIRNHPETCKLPVIVTTAKDLTNEEKYILNRNVSTILSKTSTTLNDLLTKVREDIP